MEKRENLNNVVTDPTLCTDPKIVQDFWDDFFTKLEIAIFESEKFKDLSQEEKDNVVKFNKDRLAVVVSKKTLKKELLDLKIEEAKDIDMVYGKIYDCYEKEIEQAEKDKKYFEQKKILKSFPSLLGKDLSKYDLTSLSKEQLLLANYDSNTKWPPEEKLPQGFNPEQVFEEGKNPGLGVRDLHARGITGKGVHVAIIDQKISSANRQEYKDSIILNEVEKVDEYESMHGPAVASIFVGEDCGVAPGSQLHYYSTNKGRNFEDKAKSIESIIEYNKSVPDSEKIRIISNSVGYGEDFPEPGLTKYIELKNKAEQNGIVFLDTNSELYHGGGSPENKDDLESYKPALSLDIKTAWAVENFSKKSIVIPCDYRTYSSSSGENNYEYCGQGGLSWSVPYLAGLMALGLQVNPKLNKEELESALIDTAVTNKLGVRVVNPKGFIEKIESTRE